MSHLALLTEFAVLFLLLPLAVRFLPIRLPLLPLLWLATLYCWLILRHDPTFSQAALWNSAATGPNLLNILALFAAIGVTITLAVHLFAHELLFTLVRYRPALWLFVMLLYPVLSVYPQGIVYRAFLMHRYAALFPNPSTLILVSAAAFGFMHIVFRNPIAPALTFFGGILFAWRFHHTQSLAVSSLEHALYGCLLFTIGLGQYFYGGTLPAPSQRRTEN